jgi:hypothetical protein
VVLSWRETCSAALEHQAFHVVDAQIRDHVFPRALFSPGLEPGFAFLAMPSPPRAAFPSSIPIVLAMNLHAHTTLSETVGEAAMAFYGGGVHQLPPRKTLVATW